MRRIKKPKIGEYCLVSRWADKDCCDPWAMGLIDGLDTRLNGRSFYRVEGSERWFQCCHRLSDFEKEHVQEIIEYRENCQLWNVDGIGDLYKNFIINLQKREIRLGCTYRGFRIGKFEDHNGHACSVQESSADPLDKLWLGMDDPLPEHLGEPQGCRAHLTREQIMELIPMLQYFVDHGRLPEPEKE